MTHILCILSKRTFSTGHLVDSYSPEVWGSTYDVRSLIDAAVKLRDGKKITDMDLPFIQRVALKEVLKKIEGTDLEKFLKEYHAI